MTVAELIDELMRYPDHYKVLSCDGMGLSGDARVEQSYDEDREEVWVVA